MEVSEEKSKVNLVDTEGFKTVVTRKHLKSISEPDAKPTKAYEQQDEMSEAWMEAGPMEFSDSEDEETPAQKSSFAKVT